MKTGRKVEYFCIACALETIGRDIETLKEMQENLNKNLSLTEKEE